MKEAQSQDAANDCREIVLAKEQIVKAAYKAAGIKIRTVRLSVRASDLTSYIAGDAAGRRVSISSGALPGSNGGAP
jgi:hypothetical protein